MKNFILPFLLCSALAARVVAGTNGIIEGVVVDAALREPLVGVTVAIVGTPMGTATNVDGGYQINNVRAGVYELRFSMLGYKTVVMKKVTVLPDLRTRIDVSMDVSAVEMGVVEVRVERPLIQTDLPSTAYSIGELKLDKLPVTAFQDVLGLQPGTTLEGNVRGGKTNEVMFLVDGLPIQDVIGGGIASSIPKSSITGMTIHTGGFEAEYGNATSGVVNVVTKTGGNAHRVGIRVERDGILPGNLVQQTDKATDIELSAGGPIETDRWYYFTANRMINSGTRWWQDFERFPISPVNRELTGFGKLEFFPSSSIRLGLQGIYSLHDWRDYEFSWRFNLGGLPERKRDSYRIALILAHTLSDNVFYTLSLSRYFLNSEIGGGQKPDPNLKPYEYDFFLRYVVGGNRNWWAQTQQTSYTLKGDLTLQMWKSHILKAGFELNQFDIASDVVKFEPQLTYFGKPIFGAPQLNFSNQYNYRPSSGSVYLQDKIELVKDGSNFSVGVRWDFLDPTAERPIVEYIPISQNEYQQKITGTAKASFKHQFSPRIAFAAPVGPASFFFVNFGHYFQFPLFDYLYSGITPAQLKSGTRNVLTGNPDLQPERTVSWEIGFKHGINEHFVGSVTYFQKRMKNQIDSKTLIPFDSKSAGDFGFASYVNNSQAEASGLEFVLSRERSEKWTGSISYTYMVTEGLSEYVDQTINLAQWGFPLAAKPYPLSWDQRHTLKADFDFQLPMGIQTNVIVLYNSARPYTFYPTRDGFAPLDSTKVFVPNNARMGNVMFVNLKLSKAFDLDETARQVLSFYADIRNVLNEKNIRWMDSSGRVGGELSDPAAYHDPRRVRLGVRFDF